VTARTPPQRISQKVSKQIAHWIVDEIIEDHLESGDPLDSEAVMIERYDVSRASLREALRLLEVQGVISMKSGPGGGPRVNKPSALDFGNMVSLHFQLAGTTFRELADARLLLESHAAALAAKNTTQKGVQRLREALSLARNIGGEDGSLWQRESMRFHDVIMDMTKNTAIQLFAKSMNEVFTDRVVGGRFHPLDADKVNNDHEKIAEAIADGDVERASGLMLDHTEVSTNFFKRRLPGLFDEVVTWREGRDYPLRRGTEI
jgi:GntR family transcriptional regulator, transcriptional repressor for pyruvate dehydrogenase complex